jgi:hypothetical protein
MYDPKAEGWELSNLFAQCGQKDRETAQPWYVCHAREGETARAGDSILQERGVAFVKRWGRTKPFESGHHPLPAELELLKQASELTVVCSSSNQQHASNDNPATRKYFAENIRDEVPGVFVDSIGPAKRVEAKGSTDDAH